MSRFMIPVASNDPFIRYEWNNEENYVPADVEGTLPDDAIITGRYGGLWFSRLSAPGYMDATDWTGPQSTEGAALYDLWVVFGNSEETFTEFIEGKKHIVAGSLTLRGVRDELYGWNVEDMKDIHLATMGDVEEGYDPNDDDLEVLQEAYDFVACGAIESARLKKRFETAEKEWGGS